jgi:Fe-S-cluster containining protein
MENSPNKHGPCEEKNCGYCCDPVRVDTRNLGEPPLDKLGRKIFTSRGEILRPKENPEITIKTFNCVNYDSVLKKCLDHENRPDMCRNSSCIEDQKGDIDKQHDKATSPNKFIKIFPR